MAAGLLAQFHDILPGSSIAWVHRDAEQAYAEVADVLHPVVATALASLAGDGAERLAFNAAPHARAGVPALGAAAPEVASGASAADTLVAGLPRWAWQQLSAGAGAKGERYYDWAWITLTPDNAASGDTDNEDTGCWWLLSGVTGTPASWRSTAATPRTWCRCASWSASLAAAGASRSPSRRARALPGSMSTRSAAGRRGSAGRCWR